MPRLNSGAMLVELMVALVIAGLFMVSLTASLTELMRVSSQSQNNIIGVQIANNIFERVRATSFDRLGAINSDLVVNRLFEPNSEFEPIIQDPANPLLTVPLMIDATGKLWVGPSGSPVSKVQAKAHLTILPVAGDFDSKVANVQVSWKTPGGGIKAYSTSTFIHRYGMVFE